MAIVNDARLQEAFSLALEDRSSGYSDLVTNSNVAFYEMKQRGGWKTFSGPKIRERLLYNESGTYTRYSGFDYLNPQSAELFNDAEYEPKMAAVSVAIAGEDILKNSGANQLMDLFTSHVDAAEMELVDRFTEDLHSTGVLANQVEGLQAAIPTDPTTGTYGGIDRSTYAIWRTNVFDANSDFTGITAVNSTTVKTILNQIVYQTSRRNKGPNLWLCSEAHFEAYAGATEAIQRITDETKLSKLGFTSLKYYGGGRSMDVVLEGGIGSAMPAGITYALDMDSICFRYHPDRNFSKIGAKQMPVNQDGWVQHIGFMGNLTVKNPIHLSKLHDSA